MNSQALHEYGIPEPEITSDDPASKDPPRKKPKKGRNKTPTPELLLEESLEDEEFLLDDLAEGSDLKK